MPGAGAGARCHFGGEDHEASGGAAGAECHVQGSRIRASACNHQPAQSAAALDGAEVPLAGAASEVSDWLDSPAPIAELLVKESGWSPLILLSAIADAVVGFACLYTLASTKIPISGKSPQVLGHMARHVLNLPLWSSKHPQLLGLR